MSYTFQKIALLFSVPFGWIVTNIVISSITLSEHSSRLTVDIMIAFVFVSLIIAIIWGVRSWKRISRHQRQTYDWYIKNNPDLFKNGRVTCKKCSGGIIHTRNLFKRTFTREHFCTQCGTTLYYSPES